MFVYTYKNPQRRTEKHCLLANTYANEPIGHAPRNIFSLFYSLQNLFGLTKSIKKCGGNLNDQIKRNNGIKKEDKPGSSSINELSVHSFFCKQKKICLDSCGSRVLKETVFAVIFFALFIPL